MHENVVGDDTDQVGHLGTTCFTFRAKSSLVTSIGAATIMTGMLVLLAAVIGSWRSGVKAPMNPWQAKSLEWTVPYPVPLENFETLPVVTEDAYGYGRKSS